jgi:hypothetical protein
MPCWNIFLTWFTATSNQPLIMGALALTLIVVIAIVLSSLLAALVSRRSIKHLIDQRDREQKNAAIASLIDAATEASVWNSLTPQEQVMSDRAVGQADIQLRLLPIKGASTAANWAAHQLAELKRTSATFGYQLEPALMEFRDSLLDWQKKPSRGRKMFQTDLERWKAQSSTVEKTLIAEQDAWVAQQHHNQFAAEIKPASRLAETQRLLNDVEALEVKPAAASEPVTMATAMPVATVPADTTVTPVKD